MLKWEANIPQVVRLEHMYMYRSRDQKLYYLTPWTSPTQAAQTSALWRLCSIRGKKEGGSGRTWEAAVARWRRRLERESSLESARGLGRLRFPETRCRGVGAPSRGVGCWDDFSPLTDQQRCKLMKGALLHSIYVQRRTACRPYQVYNLGTPPD